MFDATYWRTRIGITSLLVACAIAAVPPVTFWWLRYAVEPSKMLLLLQSGIVGCISALLGVGVTLFLRKGTMAFVEALIADQKAQNLRFDTAINKMAQGLCFFDGAQRLIVCNDKYADMYRLPRDLVRPGTTLREIVDHRFAAGCFPRMEPDEYLRWRDAIAVAKNASDSVVELADGRIIAIHHEPMPDSGWVATHEDITALERTKNELKALNANLEQRVHERTAALEASNRDLETFAYSVAHDFRAPLRAMNGYAMLLADALGSELGDEAREHLQKIRASSVRLGKLIDGLLNLAQVAKQEVGRETVDLGALAEAGLAALRAKEPNRKVESVIARGMSVSGDRAMFASLLDELLGNAWKFTATRPVARIEVGALTEAGERSYFVRDNGVGFDPAHATKLFAPFTQLHPIDAFPGTGIGLALAKRIVERHGGRIWAEAEAGKGATFRFTLAAA